MHQRIGFIGLGTMGQAMARNIHKAGHSLCVYNRSPGKCEPFAADRIPVCATPRQLAAQAEVIVIMVTGPEALLAVLQGEDGVLAGMAADTTVINMSTVSPEATMEAAALVEAGGGVFIDAPVSGTKQPAEDGTLAILAGGDVERIEALKPLFLAMGKTVIHCGPIGHATGTKLTINLLLGTMMESLAEALVFGTKMGIRPETLFETIKAGPLNAPFFSVKGEAICQDEFSKKFAVDLMFKDLNLVLEAAGRQGVMLPATAAARETLSGARALGHGDEDMAAVIKVLEKVAGVVVRSSG